MVFFGVPRDAHGVSDATADANAEAPLTEQEQAAQKKAEEEQQKKQDALEEKKKDLEKSLKKKEKKQQELKKALRATFTTLGVKRSLVAQTESQVQAKAQEIKTLAQELARLEKEQALQRAVLLSTLRQLYYAKSDSITTNILESNPSTSFLLTEDRLWALRDKAHNTYTALDQLAQEVKQKQDEIAMAKKDQEQLLETQKKQEQEIAQQARNTQQEVKRVEATIAQLNAKLSSIEASLSQLLGKSFSTSDIVAAASFASKQTGVRKDFILGMLTQETSLGRYTGGCTYKKSRMGSTNAKIFKRITKELGYNYKKKKVSCPLSYGIGGAMGVAQFMPTTWVHYEETVAKYTGNYPADPWSLTDGVMAMAIKLQRDGGAKKSGENTAARRYYCGSNIGRRVCANYANNVLYWAKNYKRLLK